ncbi:MAG TPA: hypothetical protein VLH38_01870 [Patescibacteria group bacterium]|nr:hypothetical protein [Patescibacteria group bacterium]
MNGFLTTFSNAKKYILASQSRLVGVVFASLVALTGGAYLVVSSYAATIEKATITIGGPINQYVAFDVGYDHTHTSHIFGNGNQAAATSAKTLLASLQAPQNVHIMGFGVDNPNPSKGKYEFERSGLDDRIRLMAATTPEAQRIITLCTAPGWMKGTRDDNIEAAPLPKFYPDFATLSAAVATRYDGTHKDSKGQLLPRVNNYVVWNEFKGFYLANGDFDSKSYVTFYNGVYTAVKQVRPNVKLGGPYVGMNTDAPTNDSAAYGSIAPRSKAAMAYWLKNKKGAEFITMDGGPQLKSNYLATNGYTAGDLFTDAAKYVRGLDEHTYPGAKTLPLWWTEFYPGTSGESKNSIATGQHAVSITMDNIRKAGIAGVNRMLLWEPEGTASGDNPDTHVSLWTNTANAGGGKPTAFYAAAKGLHDYFPVGTQYYSFTTSNPLVVGLASKDRAWLIVRGDKKVSVTLNGRTFTMDPYAVQFVQR